MCSLRFENNLLSREGVRFDSISENTIIEAFLRFRFASVAITKLVSCLGRKNRASQLNQRHSDVYRSAVNFSRGWQP